MQYDDFGTMIIRTYGASNALPVEGVLVRVRGADEFNRMSEFSLFTDEDGLTNEIKLPAPSKSYSLSQGSKEVPFAIYDVEISKDGFYTKKIQNVAVFSGIRSFLPVNMIPVEEGAYPRGNINAVITENESLYTE